MPINKVIKGDLVQMAEKGTFNVIVHGCNCFYTMGAGIAKQLADKWPDVLGVDKAYTTKGDILKLGKYTICFVASEDNPLITRLQVINAYTQFQYGAPSHLKHVRPPVDYLAIEKVFTQLNKVYGTKKGTYNNVRMGIPKIGAGLAGGDWEQIEKIINAVTPDLDITLVEYKGG